ncbi:MAG: hypothetical protein V1739_10205 [Candidatus Omnitrophota bacterium]
MLNKDNNIERDLGEQPVKQIMLRYNLKPHDLVAVSAEQITHRMVARAGKGRRLSPHIKTKVLNALNKAANEAHPG